MSYLTPPWASPQSVQSVLVTPMTEALYTIDEALLRAGLSWVGDDPRRPMVTDWIAAAQAKVELDTGLALLTQTRDVTFTTTDWWTPLPAQCTPVQALEEVDEELGLAPLLTLIGPSRYAIAPGCSGMLRVTAGWTSKADFKARVPLLYHAVGLLIAHYATAGRDLAITGTIVATMPEGYAEAVAPHVLVWMP